jgi:hypothetical protein
MSANNPTSPERLEELVDKFEIATTDGEIPFLTGNDLGDIYLWLFWCKTVLSAD